MAERIAFDSLLSTGSAGLWSQLPRELGALFRPGVVELTEDILRELRCGAPALSPVPADDSTALIVMAIQRAVVQFIDRLEDPAAAQQDQAELLYQLGLHETPDGAVLDSLQSAYRAGARVAWRHMSRIGQAAGVPLPTLGLLAEAIFAYTGELSAQSIAGLVAAQARAAGALDRRRRTLLDAILTRAEGLDRAAEQAGWPPPERVVAVALRIREEEVERPGVDRRMLADLERADPCLLLAETDLDLLDEITLRLPVLRAAAGPVVTLAHACDSLRWAGRMLRFVERGILPDVPLTRFDEHMSALWLLHDPFLLKELSDRALAPLAGLAAPERDQLGETLLAWLESRRGTAEIAQILGVPPRTVRYRLRRIEQLFGDRLDDPQVRFDLEVALRARRVPALSGFTAPGS
ncbi:MAG TPA: helix-turn-helix domain-containing protein [Actinophytocola sp.]|uniref:PucR family transcriptional regulator n=1 Tax=Actinophytocola sp. TaxID=1872138 RepID=UPI002DBFE83D|nr:helix-turn-helix domain-containing protein [Actinophytocola sp.]HEU5470294.1 helix-turn-helix domain-containing protein [Actinophytocola sp.]